jgi:hypothetical protein
MNIEQSLYQYNKLRYQLGNNVRVHLNDTSWSKLVSNLWRPLRTTLKVQLEEDL